MVPAFPVFGLMVDDGTVDLHFSGGEVTLEVLHIGRGVPQTPFYKGEQFQLFRCTALIPKRQFLYFRLCF